MKLPKLSQWSARERWIAASCAVVLLFMLMDRVVMREWLRHTMTVQDEIKKIRHSLVTQQKLLDRKSEVEAQAQRYRDYLLPAGPEDLEMAALLKEIEGLAKQSQVSLNEVKPLPSTNEGLYRKYQFEVRSECSLPQWIRFVYLVETSSSLFQIQKAEVEVKEEKPDALQGYLRIMTIAL